jgi:uncharacterized protein (DUF433 family)
LQQAASAAGMTVTERPDDQIAVEGVHPHILQFKNNRLTFADIAWNTGPQPCIRGHRIWVSLILDLLASGMKEEGALEEYPQLTAEDIQACLAYAPEMDRTRKRKRKQ